MDERGATIKSISAGSGLKEEDVWEYLRTHSVPKAEALLKLARALGTSVRSLDPPPPPRRVVDPAIPGISHPRVTGLEVSPRKEPAGALRVPTHRKEPHPIERAARRQDALIWLLAKKGYITQEEWDSKAADLIPRRPGRS